MSSKTSSKKFLIIFDFDGTIIDQDSEEELLKNIFTKEEYNKIMNVLENLEFFDGFNYYFKRMKDLGITLKDMDSKLQKFQLTPKIKELFDYLRKIKTNSEIIICSSGIDYSIKYILKYHGFLDLFDDFICTKGNIEGEKSDKLLNVPKDQFPHSCGLCGPSQCKSTELRKYIKKNKNKFEKIIFVCDGSNDFCPSKKILKKGDILFPRIDNRFYIKLFKENFKNELACQIYPWKSADEIIPKLKKI